MKRTLSKFKSLIKKGNQWNFSILGKFIVAATEQVSVNNEENLATIEEITSHSGNLNEIINTIKVSISRFNI